MPKQPIASLSASLMTPPTPVDQMTTAPPPAPPAPPPVVTPPPVQATSAPAGAGKSTKPIAQTVKLDHRLFVRLKNFSANRRQSHQVIFVAALQEYLDRNGG